MKNRNYIRTFYYSIGFILLLPICCMQKANAQQDPMYSQYMFNTLPINPAYAGSREMLSVMVLGRKQWVGFENAPSTATLSIHSPVYKNMAAGGSLVYDTYGPVKQTSFFVDYAYHLKMGEKMKLSMGLSGGFNFYSVDYNNLYKESFIDDAYSSAVEQMFLPNLGFGLFLYSSKFYLGVSIPRIMENDYESESFGNGNGKEVRHYYAMTGYVVHFSENFALRPSVMTRMSEGAPFSVDLNINSILYDKFWLGVMYRLDDSVGGMVQYQISSQLKVGYAFDFNTNELSSYHSGSHEVMINYELNFDKKRFYSPRYF